MNPSRPNDSSIGARLRAGIRQSALYAPIRRRKLEQLTQREGAYPDWTSLLASKRAEYASARATARGPRILIATSLGLHFTANTIDSLLAVALSFRGARPEILLCDGALAACQMIDHGWAPSIARYAQNGPSADFCGVCAPAGARNFAPLDLPVRKISDYISSAEMESAAREAEACAATNLNPERPEGAIEHGYAGALRFFGRSRLPDDDLSRAVLARYLTASFCARRAAENLFAAEHYDVVVAHHGIYAPQGSIADAARAADIRLVTWHPSYRKGRLIYEHGDTYHRAMIDEPAERWARKALDPAEDAALDAYLASRVTGSQDWITFQRAAPQPDAELEKAVGFSFDKPTVILIGNVAWDARLHYKSSAYGDMIEWASQTAQWFAAHPDRQLIVRCHPGEVLSNPRAADRLDDAVRACLPTLPPNISIVPPESRLNTYALAARCTSALIYNTKMGVELAARGMPVIVAGDAWIRGKGISVDVSSPQKYEAALREAHQLPNLDAQQLTLARRYAFHFFFRRCLPVDLFDLSKGWPLCSLVPEAAARAMAGCDAGLDAICQGILTGAPFEYDGPRNSQ